MGQYYNILTYKNRKYTVYDRSLKNSETDTKSEYVCAKIMEHSWIYNETMESFSNIIFENPIKVAWVGDYADECENEDIHNEKLGLEKIKLLHKIAWNRKSISLIRTQFDTEKMLLINWDKKQYVNMQEYIENNTYEGWCIHPLSLLTAIGNGFGGGDYRGINLDKVGIWAYDTISFEKQEKEQEFIDNNFNKLFLEFNEN